MMADPGTRVEWIMSPGESWGEALGTASIGAKQSRTGMRPPGWTGMLGKNLRG